MQLRQYSLAAQFGFLFVPLPLLIFLGNPAIGLLVGSALSLSFNGKIIPRSSQLGKLALQTAIILLGLKLDANRLIQISADYSLLVTAYVLITLAVGLLIGKMINNNPVSSQLISSGTAICGGTTIASMAPIINARPEQTAVALTLVFLLNAVALFIYPHIGHYLSLSQEQFGIWCALSIHDTSSVVATALIYGEESGAVATTLKLFLDVRTKLVSKLGRLLEPLIHTANPLQFFGQRNALPHLQLLWFVMEEYFRSLRFLWKNNE